MIKWKILARKALRTNDIFLCLLWSVLMMSVCFASETILAYKLGTTTQLTSERKNSKQKFIEDTNPLLEELIGKHVFICILYLFVETITKLIITEIVVTATYFWVMSLPTKADSLNLLEMGYVATKHLEVAISWMDNALETIEM